MPEYDTAVVESADAGKKRRSVKEERDTYRADMLLKKNIIIHHAQAPRRLNPNDLHCNIQSCD